MYLNDNSRIMKAKITSKNNEKLKEFILKNINEGDSRNYEFNMPYDFSLWHINEIPLKEQFRLKKYKSLCIASAALKSSNMDMPIRGVTYTSDLINLYPLFRYKDFECYEDGYNKDYIEGLERDIDFDFSIIESIVGNPYFYEILEKMYSDYSGFLEIFSYIDFEYEDVYTIYEVNELYKRSIYEYKHSYPSEKVINRSYNAKQLKSAINSERCKENYKILTRTKNLITKLDK